MKDFFRRKLMLDVAKIGSSETPRYQISSDNIRLNTIPPKENEKTKVRISDTKPDLYYTNPEGIKIPTSGGILSPENIQYWKENFQVQEAPKLIGHSLIDGVGRHADLEENGVSVDGTPGAKYPELKEKLLDEIENGSSEKIFFMGFANSADELTSEQIREEIEELAEKAEAKGKTLYLFTEPTINDDGVTPVGNMDELNKKILGADSHPNIEVIDISNFKNYNPKVLHQSEDFYRELGTTVEKLSKNDN